MIIIIGNAEDEINIRRSRIVKASHLITTCCKEETNVNIALIASQIVNKRKGDVLNCFIHIIDPELRDFLMSDKFKSGVSSGIRYHYFNIYEIGAYSILNEYPVFLGEGTQLDNIVIYGFDLLGQQLLLSISKTWYQRINKELKADITIIGREVSRGVEQITNKYSYLLDSCDLNVIDLHDFDQYSIGEKLGKRFGIENKKQIYICLDQDLDTIKCGFIINSIFSGEKTSIVVITKRNEGMAKLVANMHKPISDNVNLHFAGFYENACNIDYLLNGLIERISRSLHSGYLSYVKTKDGSGYIQTKNKWVDLPNKYKESCRKEAEHIYNRLTLIGCELIITRHWDDQQFQFSEDEIETLSRSEHERWKKERLAAGWKLGDKRNEKKRINPNLVKWDSLPCDVQEYNKRETMRIPINLARVGITIRRKSEVIT